VGVDYGTTNPCAFVLLGINKHRYPNVWVEDEYYYNSRVTQRQKTDSEYAEDLRNFIEGRNVTAIYLDPSAASFRAEIIRSGISNLIDAENDVIDGIRFVAKLLNQGTFKICRKCRNMIAEFQSYVWDEKSIKSGVDKPKKENDHSLDALRYALYSHFFVSEQGALTAKELDRNYNEAMGAGPELPPFFQQPNAGYSNPSMRF
jgi:PBSX family phage terminase large subunit